MAYPKNGCLGSQSRGRRASSDWENVCFGQEEGKEDSEEPRSKALTVSVLRKKPLKFEAMWMGKKQMHFCLCQSPKMCRLPHTKVRGMPSAAVLADSRRKAAPWPVARSTKWPAVFI